MKILAVDTSSMIAAVAVKEGNTLLGEYILNDGHTHSQKLIPMIMELMSGLGLQPTDIDVYAASIGPGSFTGLRIGVVTVKSMAYAVNKPVVGVPTLDALAYNLPPGDKLICPIIDARNMQVYTAFYSWDEGIFTRKSDYMAVAVQELSEKLKDIKKQCVFTGDGVLVHKELLKSLMGEKVFFAPGNLLLQKASSVAELGLLKFLEGQYEKPFDLTPFYLRKPQAERKFDSSYTG